MNVLFINTAGPFGGSGRSLFELMSKLKEQNKIDVKIVMQQGTSMNYYKLVTNDIITVPGLSRFDNTRLTFYKGIRWLVTIREFLFIPFTIMAILNAKRLWKNIDIIHVNEITDIIPAILAKIVFKAPLVVHVRSLQRPALNSIRAKWLYSQLRKASAIIAIDSNVRASLPKDLIVHTIHNSFSVDLDKKDLYLREKLKNLRQTSLKIGFVGNLHIMKGIFDLIEAVNILRGRGIDIECIIAGGETRSDSKVFKQILKILGLAQNIGVEVQSLISQNGISDSVYFLGPVNDISAVYTTLDIIMFPSYYDAPGRPVFEAAFFSVPSIVCIEKPFSDTFIQGETGISVPPKNPNKLAEALLYFYNNKDEILRMGANAKTLANKNFVSEKNAKKVYALYCQILNSISI
jgi:glycosyltransferase involved in cell wall biosynthesis